MARHATSDTLSIQSERLNDWALVDMTFRLRLRALRDLCLQPLFHRLETNYRLSEMRRSGITQVMYYLDFEQREVPLAIGTPLYMQHKMSMHLSRADREGWPSDLGRERLLWHLVSRVDGYRHDAEGLGSLGAGEGRSKLVRDVGVGRSIHILTRPTADQANRAVTAVPNELQSLKVHAWPERLPGLTSLSEHPQGYLAAEPIFEQEYSDIWGVSNTDANQHVNVVEYIIGIENQTSRHLAALGLDVARHRLRRLRILFRRPCFAGEWYRLTTRLFFFDDNTYFIAEYRPLVSGGRVSVMPAVIAVAEGRTGVSIET